MATGRHRVGPQTGIRPSPSDRALAAGAVLSRDRLTAPGTHAAAGLDNPATDCRPHPRRGLQTGWKALRPDATSHASTSSSRDLKQGQRTSKRL